MNPAKDSERILPRIFISERILLRILIKSFSGQFQRHWRKLLESFRSDAGGLREFLEAFQSVSKK